MFIKTRILVAIAVAVIVAMVIEWHVASGWSRTMTAHYFHGVCNAGVGQPYQDFIHQLRGFYESGDTNKLGRVLTMADTNSLDIYSVWLYEDYDAYRSSIRKILN